MSFSFLFFLDLAALQLRPLPDSFCFKRWPTAFNEKVIAQSMGLHRTSDLQDLIDAAEYPADGEGADLEDMGENISKFNTILDSSG